MQNVLKFVYNFSKVIFLLQNIVLIFGWWLFGVTFIFMMSTEGWPLFIKNLIIFSIIALILFAILKGVYILLNRYQIQYSSLIYLFIAVICIWVSEYNLWLNSPFSYLYSRLNNIQEADQVLLPIEATMTEEVDNSSKSVTLIRFKFNIRNDNEWLFDYSFYVKDEAKRTIYCSPYTEALRWSGSIEFQCFSQCSKSYTGVNKYPSGSYNCQRMNYKKLISAELSIYKIRDKRLLFDSDQTSSKIQRFIIKNQSFPIVNGDVFSGLYTDDEVQK